MNHIKPNCNVNPQRQSGPGKLASHTSWANKDYCCFKRSKKRPTQHFLKSLPTRAHPSTANFTYKNPSGTWWEWRVAHAGVKCVTAKNTEDHECLPLGAPCSTQPNQQTCFHSPSRHTHTHASSQALIQSDTYVLHVEDVLKSFLSKNTLASLSPIHC